jgi:hypothetical protein
MTEKLTRIVIGKKSRGILEWGEIDPKEMIARFREYAAGLRQEAEKIENAADEDFQIDVVRGSVVQHHVKTLQNARNGGKQ